MSIYKYEHDLTFYTEIPLANVVLLLAERSET